MDLLILQVFCAVFSGVMEGLAIPSEFIKFGSPLIAIFSLSPLYFAVNRSKSYRETALLFGLQVATVHCVSSFWLAFFHGYGAATLGASLFGTFVEGVCAGVIFHALRSWNTKQKEILEASGKSPYASFKRVFWFTSCFTIWEFTKSVGDLAYPWGTLFTAAYKWKIFTQIADIFGYWGVTFFYALLSSFIGEGFILLEKSSRENMDTKVLLSYRQLGKMVLCIVLLSGIYGTFKYLTPEKVVKTANIVVVQHNKDSWTTPEDEVIEKCKELTDLKIHELRSEGKKADLVVWSEGILRGKMPRDRDFYENFMDRDSLSSYIKSVNAPFIIGGGTRQNDNPRHNYNSAIFFDSQGKYSGFYSKKQLVPFAEYVLHKENPLIKWIMQDLVHYNSNGYEKGRENVNFKIPLSSNSGKRQALEEQIYGNTEIALDSRGWSNPAKTEKYIINRKESKDSYLSFATPICFEDAFPYVCRSFYHNGAELFVNITNDSWSNKDSSEIQHFVLASYLAIQFRIPLLRATNSGYSVLVNPNGKILADLPLFEEASMAIEVPIYEKKATFYSSYGDWFPRLLLAIVILSMLYSVLEMHLKGKKIPVHLFSIKINVIKGKVFAEKDVNGKWIFKTEEIENEEKEIGKISEIEEAKENPVPSPLVKQRKSVKKAPEKKSSVSKNTRAKKSDSKAEEKSSSSSKKRETRANKKDTVSENLSSVKETGSRKRKTSENKTNLSESKKRKTSAKTEKK